jgi:sulfur carrier protein
MNAYMRVMRAKEPKDGMDKMRVIVNGDPMEIEAATLDAALTELKYGGMTVATALNRNFVPAPKRAETPLKSGDTIEIIAPMSGG